MADTYFNRVATVDINGKTFSHPPFSIEFTVTESMRKFSTATVSLINPNSETIEKAGGKKNPPITIEAGYEGNVDIAVRGVVIKHTVKREGPNRVLEMEVSTNVLWKGDITKQSFKGTIDSVRVLADLARERGGYGSITPGDAKIYKRMVITNPLKTVEQISNDTDSIWFFRQGKLYVMDDELRPIVGESQWITFDNGLLKIPMPYKKEKQGKNDIEEAGFIANTIYKPDVGVGSSVNLQLTDDMSKTGFGMVVNASKNFSTFGNAGCVYTVRIPQ